MGYTMRDGVAYGGGLTPIVLIETLMSNATSVTFSDSKITTDGRYNLYAENNPLLKATNITISGNTLTATFPAQSINTRIKLVINENLDSYPVNAKGFSYVGMVIESTTLDTEAKVKEMYGGTTWIQHSGYVLRGATSGVTANDATKTGGSDDAIVVAHTHKTGIDTTSGFVNPGAGGFSCPVASAQIKTDTSSTGESGTNKNIPNYKSVYIWERTA